jgi:hypothetical protein
MSYGSVRVALRLALGVVALQALSCSKSTPEESLPSALGALGKSRSALVTTVGLDAAGDTYLRSGSANQNQGAATGLSLQSSGRHRTLLFFDAADVVSAVGSGTLVSARIELSLLSTQSNWGSGRDIAIHRLERPPPALA